MDIKSELEKIYQGQYNWESVDIEDAIVIIQYLVKENARLGSKLSLKQDT